MSAITTECYTSTGAVGRKRTKARRFELREARRLGALPCPSELEQQHAQPSPAPEAAAA